MVGNSMPTAIITNNTLESFWRMSVRLKRSRNAGANSIAKTTMYAITHQATSSITELSWAYQGMILAAIEHVDQQCHGVSGAPEGGADHDVDHDPDAPGITVVDMRDRAQAEHESRRQDDQGDNGQRRQRQKRFGQDLSAEGFMGVHDFSFLAFVL